MNRKRMGQFSIVAIAACAMLVRVGMASAAINITTVSVGNPGNAADGNGYGAVDYKYNIGKYDVTASQYATFLNAVAKTDTNTLYNPFMVRTDYGSGITQNGSDGNYTYSVNAAFVNRPVNNVSYWSTARFSNWLENGQPNGVQGAGTTETGTYTLTTASIANNTVSRNAGSTWSLPSEDEWYKAAYYKGGNIFADYWLYATQSDTTPGRSLSDSSGNNANFYNGSGTYPIDSGHKSTVVGQFANSPGAYGTFDQNGNVFQWNESIINGGSRGVRGGSFDDSSSLMQSGARGDYDPTTEFGFIGFRVVSQIPEPTSMAVVALGVMVIGMRRRVVK